MFAFELGKAYRFPEKKGKNVILPFHIGVRSVIIAVNIV